MPENPRILFLHGWLGNARAWDAQTARFAGSRALDLPNRCRSIGEFADAVVEVVRMEPVVLVGHSRLQAIVLRDAKPDLRSLLLLGLVEATKLTDLVVPGAEVRLHDLVSGDRLSRRIADTVRKLHADDVALAAIVAVCAAVSVS